MWLVNFCLILGLRQTPDKTVGFCDGTKQDMSTEVVKYKFEPEVHIFFLSEADGSIHR